MSTNKEIFLKDYTEPNFWIENVNLEINMSTTPVQVVSEIDFKKNEKRNESTLFLNGTDLKLKTILISGKEIEDDNFFIDEKGLTLKNLTGDFTLKTIVEIDPDTNFTGEGLYKSGDIYCTQCEAEGFRRITYYLDRPDVMASFKTKLIGPKDKFPYLLANGNKVESGDLEGGNHFATWIDPFKKPSYLFACVFGDLGVVKDTFTTKSGREVDLEIYVDHGNEDKTDHAMVSLKNSMKWDEDVYGLEYDLDIYMIVAVDSFNMGAMENKGLNIFNSAYVLAKKETATDTDFEGVEGVIGHEYFHNWTGNRVTCRDWFQLTLKEGLTVFRDQEFSSDMLDRSVKRIDDVLRLKMGQFPEDAGPMSHPIKPKSFVEINNFYTATIYEKGAEVIRMIHTLLGKENYRKGTDLYFERHDGQAVTTEDFVAAMSDASGINLDHFKVWYDQNGTPKIKVSTEFDKDSSTYKIKLTQDNLILNNDDYDCLYMPFHMSFYTKSGKKVNTPQFDSYILKDKEITLELNNITEDLIPSLNLGFSAPVNVEYEYSKQDLCVLMASDQDTFNKFDSTQRLMELEIAEIRGQLERGVDISVDPAFVEAYRSFLTNKELSNAFKAYALGLPSLAELNEKREIYDFELLPKAIKALKEKLANEFKNELVELVNLLDQNKDFGVTPKDMGERSLKNFALSLLANNKESASFDLIYKHFEKANNMTDEISALRTLTGFENSYREKALESFYDKWKHETLVIQKWIMTKAGSKLSSLSDVEAITELEVYDKKIPNLFRSLVRGFASGNPEGFHKEDGSGYKFIADKILDMDAINPQIAAGLAKSLKFLKRLDSKRAVALKAELERVNSQENLSSDTKEVISKNLGL